MEDVINYSYQLRGLKTDDEKKIRNYMRRAVARGGIISMDPEDAHAIPYLVEATEKVNFEFIPLNDLLRKDRGRIPFEEIPGHDAIELNTDLSNAESVIHINQAMDKKEVALTFDDWQVKKLY